MKIEQIKNFIGKELIKVKNPKKPYSSPDMFENHQLSGFIGKRQSGKTYSCAKLVQRLQKEHPSRVFIISPTYNSNPVLHTLNADEDDIYTDVDNCIQDLEEIQDKIKEEYEDLMKYYEDLALWKAYKEMNINDLDDLPEELLSRLYEMDFLPPVHRYGGKRPHLILVCDDMSHSKLYASGRKNPFNNLLLRHRHIHKLGISVFMLVQTFRTGIPKAIRQNLTQAFIYKSHDPSQIEMIFKEMCPAVDYETFLELYEKATQDSPHDFLTLDLNPKIRNKCFRKNFDQYLIP